MFHGPAEDRTGQLDIACRIEILELQKRNDALGHTVSVDRIGVVGEVPDGAILPEKVSPEETEPAPQARFELLCSGTLADRPQCA